MTRSTTTTADAPRSSTPPHPLSQLEPSLNDNPTGSLAGQGDGGVCPVSTRQRTLQSFRSGIEKVAESTQLDERDTTPRPWSLHPSSLEHQLPRRSPDHAHRPQPSPQPQPQPPSPPLPSPSHSQRQSSPSSMPSPSLKAQTDQKKDDEEEEADIGEALKDAPLSARLPSPKTLSTPTLHADPIEGRETPPPKVNLPNQTNPSDLPFQPTGAPRSEQAFCLDETRQGLHPVPTTPMPIPIRVDYSTGDEMNTSSATPSFVSVPLFLDQPHLSAGHATNSVPIKAAAASADARHAKAMTVQTANIGLDAQTIGPITPSPSIAIIAATPPPPAPSASALMMTEGAEKIVACMVPTDEQQQLSLSSTQGLYPVVEADNNDWASLSIEDATLAVDTISTIPIRASTIEGLNPSVSEYDSGEGSSTGRVRRRMIYRRNTYSVDMGATSSFQAHQQPSPQQQQQQQQQSRSDDELEMDKVDGARWRMEVLKKTSSRRISTRRRDEEVDRVMIGTRIGEDHVNYVLMYNMLTGIRVSVSRCNAKPQRALVEEDFTSAHKLAFDIIGNELTPSSKYDFKFKDYAPWVFRHLREDFHIDASDYLVSLTSKYILSELGSPGKSGSFFYFSQDYRFIIKTIHHAEHKFMRRILKDYFNHVKQNPHTLLCRFFGLHRVKLPHGRKIHFVVMGNVFPPNRDIHETYDLKGSTLGRAIGDEELMNNPRATQKDLNWITRNRKLELGPEKRHLFVEQIKRDVELLARLNIMDYSLLIGIHDIERGNKDNIRDNTLKVFQPDTSKKLVRVPSRRDKRLSKANALRTAVKLSDPQALAPASLPSDSFSERRYCIFYADDGGLLSTNEQNEQGQDLYYLGIIDILTPYNYVKKIEHLWKSLSQDKHAISAVNPKEYAERFLRFMIHAIKVNNDVISVLESNRHPHSE